MVALIHERRGGLLLRSKLPSLAIATLLLIALAPAPSRSSDPSEGRVGVTSPVVAWTGSFTAAANVLGTAATPLGSGCIDPTTEKPFEPGVTAGPIACDVFTLSVDLPRSYWQYPRTGQVSVALDNFTSNDDIDLEIHRRNPDGTDGGRITGSANGSGDPESAAIMEATGDYYVFAIGFTSTSGTYRGTARLSSQLGVSPFGLGRAFDPRPLSQPLYGIASPDEDPQKQRKILEAADGVDLYVETWLPKALDGHTPPARLRTILDMTPYTKQGIAPRPEFVDYFVPRGYAFAVHHVRGTGESGGCLEQTGPDQIDDGARVVEYLGRDAPWADGTVGMMGKSYDAETQISVAGLGDPAKTRYLKAIIPVASVGGQYEYSFFDGVPYTAQALASNGSYLTVSFAPGETSTPGQFVEKAECQPSVFEASADQSGDLTPFWQVRELRPGAPNIRAATLMVHGISDFNVKPITEAGFFERLPSTTPHKGVFGIWEHDYPNSHALRPEWNRSDWMWMALAWFDRYLKGLPTGVESWPPVQVQGTDGQWRGEPNWPTTGGPVGQLALGEGGVLGSVKPSGLSSFVEGGATPGTPLDGSVVFETKPLPERLEITGQPVVDVWISLDQPDAHLVAELETFDAKGEAIVAGTDFGLRSARHLDPLVDNRFAQEQGKPAPTNTPIRVSIRMLPTDLVIPKGGTVRLTLSGLLTVDNGLFASVTSGLVADSVPVGQPVTVTVLHDCEHTSALRFLTARPAPDPINVRDARTAAARTPWRTAKPISNAAGLVTASVCGRAPIRLPNFGPTIAYSAPAGAAVESPRPRTKPRVLSEKRLPATGVAETRVLGIVFIAVAGLFLRYRRAVLRR